MDNLYPNYKKEEQVNGPKPGEPMDFLRSSVSSNQIKKVDRDFLRKTNYTPNNTKTFNLGDRME